MMTKVHLTGELLLCLKGIFFLFSGLHVWSNISQSFDADQSIPAFVPIAQCQPSFGSGDSLNSWEFFSEWYFVILSLFKKQVTGLDFADNPSLAVPQLLEKVGVNLKVFPHLAGHLNLKMSW